MKNLHEWGAFFRRKTTKISDEVLDKAITSGDVNFIAKYIQDGGNVNRLIKVVLPGMAEGIAYNKEIECFPLDRATDENMRAFLIKNGAQTYEEYQNDIIDKIFDALKRE